MSKTTFEEAYEESLPSGFASTFFEADRLRRLNNADLSVLGDTVEEYQNFNLTEQDVIRNTAERVLTSFLTPERTIEFPGLGLAVNDTNNLLEKFAALYKADNDTPSGTIKDPARAGTDDVVFAFATPEVYDEIAGTTDTDFKQSGLSANSTLELVGDSGIDESASSNGAALSLDADEYLFYTGDFIDVSDGKSVVTGTQLTDVDGEDFGPVNSIFTQRLSGAHVMTTQGTYATASVDIDAKVYEAGDAEIVPVAFYMGPGTKAPGLV